MKGTGFPPPKKKLSSKNPALLGLNRDPGTDINWEFCAVLETHILQNALRLLLLNFLSFNKKNKKKNKKKTT